MFFQLYIIIKKIFKESVDNIGNQVSEFLRFQKYIPIGLTWQELLIK